MKKAVVGILNRVPVVLIVIGEALVIYLATAVAKLAFTQLDPLYSVWYRVGFMAVLLLLSYEVWQRQAMFSHGKFRKMKLQRAE